MEAAPRRHPFFEGLAIWRPFFHFFGIWGCLLMCIYPFFIGRKTKKGRDPKKGREKAKKGFEHDR
jgi:hypothetical protein